ncbi:NAD+ synthase [bacterium]|nr:NAD+ synthase [candidate division CSSED10-310 bacterium]
MRMVIGQINPIVGDVIGNTGKMIETIRSVIPLDPDLIVFPELSITGYPPRDLLERRWLIDGARESLNRIAAETTGTEFGVIVGLPVPSHRNIGRGLFNTAALVSEGCVLFMQHKRLLPSYDVFDESRYFDSAETSRCISFKDEVVGIAICEDAWNDPELWHRRLYDRDPIAELAADGATILITISASPYHVGKAAIRRRIIRNHARKHGVPFLFVNQVGGNDELVFDGRSLFVTAGGDTVTEWAAFADAIGVVDTHRPSEHMAITEPLDTVTLVDESTPDDLLNELHHALVLGLRDYVRKCGFGQVLIGLSGGIDSALVAVLAVDALGSNHVTGMTMPGPFSSEGSVTDSKQLAKNLGIVCHELAIPDVYRAYLTVLDPLFAGTPFGIAEENIQARVRGNLLMALSNKTGAMVLNTGNKSEMAVGYCTLYGDMSGGLSVLSDVFKTRVYALAEGINRRAGREVIPEAIIRKPPSAELRADQKDEDSLPPYSILDGILELYIDASLSIDEIVARGFDTATVRWVVNAVDQNEYKRRQAAPGLKVTSKAFGIGRRMPVAARGNTAFRPTA